MARLTYTEFLSVDIDDITRMSEKELKELAAVGRDIANKRIKRLRSNKLTSSPALANVPKQYKKGFTLKGRTKRQLVTQIRAQRQFLTDPTSTVRGFQEATKRVETALNHSNRPKMPVVPETPKEPDAAKPKTTPQQPSVQETDLSEYEPDFMEDGEPEWIDEEDTPPKPAPDYQQQKVFDAYGNEVDPEQLDDEDFAFTSKDQVNTYWSLFNEYASKHSMSREDLYKAMEDAYHWIIGQPDVPAKQRDFGATIRSFEEYMRGIYETREASRRAEEQAVIDSIEVGGKRFRRS